MFGIEIQFKNGKKDWIDPVSEEPTNVGGIFTVSNIYNDYQYDYEDIETWFKYDLCPVCGHDVRSYDCTQYQCDNPDNQEG